MNDIREELLKNKNEPIGINIFYTDKIEVNEKIKNILYGIEEEEIPYILKAISEVDVEVLGSNAAKNSKLGVGIGINEKEVTLYHEKLDIKKPLFRYSLDNSKELLRIIGINGARLIKGNPFVFPI